MKTLASMFWGVLFISYAKRSILKSILFKMPNGTKSAFMRGKLNPLRNMLPHQQKLDSPTQ